MQLNFLRLGLEEQHLYFDQVAGQRNLSAIVLEKDFWVCWMLGVLFSSRFRDALLFKGGTSLSKVYKVIDRFSEDIDLGLAPEFLGLSEPETDKLTSGQARKWMGKAEAACATVIRDQVQPELEQAIIATLGRRAEPWLGFELDPATHSSILWFHYPTIQPAGFDYLRRSVKLEFGSLTDQRPVGRHQVRPWLAEELPQAFDDWQCEVVALELARSFWEKATILHTEYHRPADKPIPDRYSRHYADVATLAGQGAIEDALAQDELRARVVEWKRTFFGSGWARYELAVPGTFKLVPPAERLPALRSDYRAMQGMYLGEPMDFERILAVLAELETRINATGNQTTNG